VPVTTDGGAVIGALTGITVVGLEQAVAAPFAIRQLADLGARVIKVERARDRWREVGSPGAVRAVLPAGNSSGSRGHNG
jgi:crotonobetainyl-CoA:carnitine CoA-transferase CaiB-like acyl-CoA transferase